MGLWRVMRQCVANHMWKVDRCCLWDHTIDKLPFICHPLGIEGWVGQGRVCSCVSLDDSGDCLQSNTSTEVESHDTAGVFCCICAVPASGFIHHPEVPGNEAIRGDAFAEGLGDWSPLMGFRSKAFWSIFCKLMYNFWCSNENTQNTIFSISFSCTTMLLN